MIPLSKSARMLVVCAALGISIAGCSDKRVAENARPEVVSNLATVAAQKTSVPDWLEAVGTVQAARKSTVASQTSGNIVEIRAREGDRVGNGQILAVIDDTQQRAALAQASAAMAAAKQQVSLADSQLALTEATKNRYEQLYAKKSVSPQEFDEVNARYQAASAQRDFARAEQERAGASLTQAQTALGYTQVRAPFAGVVTQKLADVGTLASPGTPVFEVEDTNRYRLEATVDENNMGFVRVGIRVAVNIDSLGRRDISGTVAQIVPVADPASRSFVVKIELPPDARIRAGLFGRARFLRGRRDALLIPRTATFERGQLQGVYVIGPGGIASLRYVTIGASSNDQVEVLSGLQEGEKLVAAPEGRELGGKQIAISR